MYMYERKKLRLIKDDKTYSKYFHAQELSNASLKNINLSLLLLFFQTNFKNGTISFNKILFYLTYLLSYFMYAHRTLN
jgi:hypothetical protein